MLLDAKDTNYQKNKDKNQVFAEMVRLPNGEAAAQMTIRANEIPFIIVALLAAASAINHDECYTTDKTEKTFVLLQLVESLVPNETHFEDFFTARTA